jgi:outer membrane protein TolC
MRKSKPIAPLSRLAVGWLLGVCCLCFNLRPAAAQIVSRDGKTIAPAEANTMTSDDFFKLVLRYHPVARQAALLTEQARSEIRFARGNFDPKLEADYENKELNNTFYYHRWNSQLKVPLWIGELKTGFERGVGGFVNGENYTPLGGLVFAGVSVPLPISQDFLIDERRNVLRQAQVFRNIAEAERVKEINKLILNAAKDYWEWYLMYNENVMLQEAYELADLRFRGVAGRVKEGDLAGIDSVEAQAILQDRAIRLREAQVGLLNARIRLSNYLWGEDDTPLELPEVISPERFGAGQIAPDETTLQRLRDLAQANHPELRKLVFKNEQLGIERRFLRDRFKPNLRLNYNFLSSPTGNGGAILPSDVNMAFLRNNYKWGFEFSYPLFLRKERGKLALNEIKIEQNDLERRQLGREIQNNIQATYNDLRNLDSLIRLQEQNVTNYRRLRDAELERFNNGESSLFLINSRETKYIEEQVKLFSLRTKYAKERAELLWAAGLSNWNEL